MKSEIAETHPLYMFGGCGEGYEERGTALVKCGSCHNTFTSAYSIKKTKKSLDYKYCPLCGHKIDIE